MLNAAAPSGNGQHTACPVASSASMSSIGRSRHTAYFAVVAEVLLVLLLLLVRARQSAPPRCRSTGSAMPRCTSGLGEGRGRSRHAGSVGTDRRVPVSPSSRCTLVEAAGRNDLNASMIICTPPVYLTLAVGVLNTQIKYTAWTGAPDAHPPVHRTGCRGA